MILEHVFDAKSFRQVNACVKPTGMVDPWVS